MNSANFRKIITLLAGNNFSIVENNEPTQKNLEHKINPGCGFFQLSSVYTIDSGISDHHTLTLTFEQSLENSSHGHQNFTRKWAKLENRKFVEDLNNILMDKLKVFTYKVCEWSPDTAFEKLHEIFVDVLDEILPMLDSGGTGAQTLRQKNIPKKIGSTKFRY